MEKVIITGETIEKKFGTLAVTTEEHLARWKEHFEEILNFNTLPDVEAAEVEEENIPPTPLINSNPPPPPN